MISNLLYLFILLAGFPTAYLLSYLCEDEIRNWRKRLLGISIASLIITIGLVFTSFEYRFPVIVTLFFVIIVNLVVIGESNRK